MTIRKQNLLEDAQVSLSSASRMLSRLGVADIPPSEVSRIQDAASQAQQAAAHLNQLVGVLLAESDSQS